MCREEPSFAQDPAVSFIDGAKFDLMAPAVVTRGHLAASGTGESPRYPGGTIRMQTPVFLKRGLDLAAMYPGTLNLDVAPLRFRLLAADHRFRNVRWTSLIPPEDFSFSRCRIAFGNNLYPGWIYYPHPETKTEHFQSPSIVEILAPWIEGIEYGSRVTLHAQSAHVSLDSHRSGQKYRP